VLERRYVNIAKAKKWKKAAPRGLSSRSSVEFRIINGGFAEDTRVVTPKPGEGYPVRGFASPQTYGVDRS